MKKSAIALSLAFLMPISTTEAKTVSSKVYYWPVLSVIDGDTISVDGSKDFALPIKVRVQDVDTPEKGSLAKCQGEKNLANRATQFTLMKVQEAKKRGYQVTFENIGWDKYGGRVVADVYLGGENLADLLIKEGLGKKYTGSGPKPSWCL